MIHSVTRQYAGRRLGDLAKAGMVEEKCACGRGQGGRDLVAVAGDAQFAAILACVVASRGVVFTHQSSGALSHAGQCHGVMKSIIMMLIIITMLMMLFKFLRNCA